MQQDTITLYLVWEYLDKRETISILTDRSNRIEVDYTLLWEDLKCIQRT